MQRLTLFGPPSLRVDGLAIPFVPERRFQLLCYLAWRDEWVRRDELATLFWGERDSSAARRNLRGLLFDLRKLPWLEGLESKADSVRWRVESDRRDFRSLVARQDHGAAVALVAGHFLDGMEANATDGFAEWLRFERKALLDRWRDALDQHIASLRGDPEATVEAARAALELDPHNEAALAALVAAHGMQGRHDAARRAYDAWREGLIRDIGVEPSTRLRAQMAGLLHADPASPRVATGPREAPAAGFVGRRSELNDLTALLRGPERRRINIFGPGGVGKSSLARAIMPRVAPDFEDWTYWVELREAANLAQAAPRLASAIGLELRGDRDPWAQIRARLAGAHALLVLDNCEHVPGLGEACEEVNAACPGLKILTTSRSRLGGMTEHVFPLFGLPVPDEDETEPAVVSAFDSVRLFEARARAVSPDFDMSAQVDDVARLVRAFEGLPLAIELAAACVRLMPVRAILEELSGDGAKLDAAAIGGAASPGRGLQATFQQSWRHLAPAEQGALARLSVFAGTFERGMGESVADATLPLLAALVDKSLLRAREGRFSLHPVVRVFARERLVDAGAVRDRHARYFARELELRLRWAGTDRLRRVADCLPDGLGAWQWMIEARNPELAAQLATPLTRALDESGRWGEGIELLNAGWEACEASGSRSALARAEIARALAMLHYRRGELDAAERRARASLRLATACRSLKGADLCLNLIGGALRQQGRWNEARGFFERALRRARAGGDGALALRAANNLATVEMATGYPERTIGICEALLAEHAEGDDKLGVAMTLVILGNANNATRRHEVAQGCYERGLELAERNNLVTMRPFFLQTLGTCHREMGRLDLAREFYRRALATSPEHLEAQIEIYASIGLARTLSADGGGGELPLLRRALEVARRTGSAAWQAAVVAAWGECLACRGERERAAALLACAAASKSIDANLGRDAALRLEALGLPPAELEACRRGAEDTTLDRIVAKLA